MSALLLVVGLAVVPPPVDCTHGVILLDNATASCITPAAANLILVGAGQSERIDVGPDGRAFIVWLPLW